MKNKQINKEQSVFEKLFSGYGGVLIVLVLFFLFFTFSTKNFFKVDNLILVLRQASTSCLTAFGITLVLLVGSIDLSVGAVYGFAAMLASMSIVNNGAPVWTGVLIAAVVGAAVGLLNGTIITKTSIPAFIGTLAVQYACRGLTYIISGGTAVTIMAEEFNRIGTASLLGLPITIYYMLVILIVLAVLLNRTKIGRYLFATGSNKTAAEFAGIKANRMIVLAHVIASTLAGLAGTVNAARVYSCTPGLGAGSEIDAIAAVVIGGTSMSGGHGSLVGTLIGTLIIAVMGNGFNHIGLNPYWQQVAKGVLLLVAVGLDGVKRRIETRRLMAAAAAAASEK